MTSFQRFLICAGDHRPRDWHKLVSYCLLRAMAVVLSLTTGFTSEEFQAVLLKRSPDAIAKRSFDHRVFTVAETSVAANGCRSFNSCRIPRLVK
jgi:hypothetical protein